MISKTNQYTYPDVSVIILTYNGVKYIERLLESLSDQSYPKERVEIIIVDNASTDNTISIVRNKYPHVKQIVLEKNYGFAGGNNLGLQYARHDFLIFLNQDTVCHRDWLSGLMDWMLKIKNIAACTSNIIPPDADEFHVMDRTSRLNHLYYCDLSPYGYGCYRKNRGTQCVFTKILSGCSFVIRRETLAELGYLFDEQFWMYAEDIDLSLRIYNLGKRICVVRDSVVYHSHNSDIKIKKSRLNLSAQAIMNRVYAFFKNMDGVEFFLFFPLLFFGGIFKIFEFPMSISKRALYFIPFSLFSMTCMLLALVNLPGFAKRRRLVIRNRRVKGLSILN